MYMWVVVCLMAVCLFLSWRAFVMRQLVKAAIFVPCIPSMTVCLSMSWSAWFKLQPCCALQAYPSTLNWYGESNYSRLFKEMNVRTCFHHSDAPVCIECVTEITSLYGSLTCTEASSALDLACMSWHWSETCFLLTQQTSFNNAGKGNTRKHLEKHSERVHKMHSAHW